MKFFVYVLYSQTLRKFYVGQTTDVAQRLEEHNRGKSKYTSKGAPWEVVTTFEAQTRSEATRLELQIKKRGIRRYLQDNGSPCPPENFGT